MIVFESHRARRLLVRLERGESLPSALLQLASDEAIGAAWVRGVGRVESAELSNGPTLGAAELVSLEGNLSLVDEEPRLEVHAVLATPEGVVGGRLRRAKVLSVEVSIEVYQDLKLERRLDPATGLHVWVGRARPAPSLSEDGGLVSWASVAAASEAATSAPPRPVVYEEVDLDPGRKHIRPARKESSVPLRPAEPIGAPRARAADLDYLDVPDPDVGDFLEHRQFGLCRVERVEDDGGLLIKLPSARRKRIKLDVFDVAMPRHDKQGRRVFQLTPRRG